MMSETDSRHGFNDLDHHVDILFDEIMKRWGARGDGGQIVDNGGARRISSHAEIRGLIRRLNKPPGESDPNREQHDFIRDKWSIDQNSLSSHEFSSKRRQRGRPKTSEATHFLLHVRRKTRSRSASLG